LGKTSDYYYFQVGRIGLIILKGGIIGINGGSRELGGKELALWGPNFSLTLLAIGLIGIF